MKLNVDVINKFFGFEPVEDFSVSDIDNVCLTDAITVISGQSVTDEIPRYVYRHHLTTYYKMLHAYACDTMIPTRYLTYINHDRIKFLYYIGKKIRMDIGIYIFNKMLRFV